MSFVTVGGRTSAVVDRVQILPEGLATRKKRTTKQERSEERDEEKPNSFVASKRRKKQDEDKSPSKWTVHMVEKVDASALDEEEQKPELTQRAQQQDKAATVSDVLAWRQLRAIRY